MTDNNCTQRNSLETQECCCVESEFIFCIFEMPVVKISLLFIAWEFVSLLYGTYIHGDIDIP